MARDRPAKQVALGVVAAVVAEELDLIGGLDALGDDLVTE